MAAQESEEMSNIYLYSKKEMDDTKLVCKEIPFPLYDSRADEKRK